MVMSLQIVYVDIIPTYNLQEKGLRVQMSFSEIGKSIFQSKPNHFFTGSRKIYVTTINPTKTSAAMKIVVTLPEARLAPRKL